MIGECSFEPLGVLAGLCFGLSHDRSRRVRHHSERQKLRRTQNTMHCHAEKAWNITPLCCIIIRHRASASSFGPRFLLYRALVKKDVWKLPSLLIDGRCTHLDKAVTPLATHVHGLSDVLGLDMARNDRRRKTWTTSLPMGS